MHVELSIFSNPTLTRFTTACLCQGPSGIKSTTAGDLHFIRHLTQQTHIGASLSTS